MSGKVKSRTLSRSVESANPKDLSKRVNESLKQIKELLKKNSEKLLIASKQEKP